MATDSEYDGEPAHSPDLVRVSVDFTLIGIPRSGMRVTVPLLNVERGRIQAGDQIVLVGDTVPDYQVVAIEVLSDPAAMVVEFH